MLDFSGANMLPGIQAVLTTAEGRVWWGLREQQVVQQVVLDSTANWNNASTDQYVLPIGLILGKITTTGKFAQFDPAATDGTQIPCAVLLWDQQMKMLGTAYDRMAVALVGGNLVASNLYQDGVLAPGISTTTNEFIIRSHLARNFRFDDDLTPAFPTGRSGGAYPYFGTPIFACDDDKTITIATYGNNAVFSNYGAGKAITFTLPAVRVGMHYTFLCIADYGITVARAGSNTLCTYNLSSYATVSINTTGKMIGGSMEVLGVLGGTSGMWFVIPHLGFTAGTGHLLVTS